MLLQSVIALFALLPIVASAPQVSTARISQRNTDIQQCHGHRCKTKSAATSAAATSEVPSVTDETPAPAESSSPSTSITTEEVSASTSAKPAGDSATPPASGGGRDYWKPSMSDTFVVDLENTPIPSNAASVYIVDLAHSA